MYRLLAGLFGWIFRMFRNAVAVLGTLAALAFILVVGFSIWMTTQYEPLPGETVLAIDARGGFSDSPTPGLFSAGPISFVDLIFALDQARDDERVKGVLLRVGDGGVAGAHAQELKAALARFREAREGRFVIAQAGAFQGPGLGQYYLASLADEIWLQQGSEFGAVGMLSQTVFMRGLFDKVSAKADMIQRYEYKNAANVYTQTDYTPAHREATTSLLNSVFGTLTDEIAARRKMDPAGLRALIDNAPYLTAGALGAHLVDKVGFYDDAEDAAKKRAGEHAEIVTIEDYYAREGAPYDKADPARGAVALVLADGPIMDGASRYDDLEGPVMGGETIADAIREAAEDDEVKAIVLRVNSPGGSALASDVMLDQLRKAQGRGKKVIVSMGPVAASGGYWISMYADKIFASATTITGSIGVLSGKLIVDDTYRLVGLNPAEIGVGANANMYSPFAEWTPDQRAKFEAGVDEIYGSFTHAVAEGRKLPIERVREIAKGRVWSGRDALELKLVDAEGGLTDALDEAAKIAGLDGEAPFAVKRYPQVNVWGDFLGQISGAASTARKLSALVALIDTDAARLVLRTFGGAEAEGRQIRMQPMDVR